MPFPLPTSSIVPIAAEVGAERRMYLPLACIVTLVILGADALWRRFGAQETSRALAKSFLWTVGAIVVVLVAVTIVRDREYASALTMARTILARWPTPMALIADALDANPATHSGWSSFGRALFSIGRAGEAAEAFGRAVAASPGTGHYHQNLALALPETARISEAASHAQQAVALLPGGPGSHNALGRVLAAQGYIDEALRECRRALDISPNYALRAKGCARSASSDRVKEFDYPHHRSCSSPPVRA